MTPPLQNFPTRRTRGAMPAPCFSGDTSLLSSFYRAQIHANAITTSTSRTVTLPFLPRARRAPLAACGSCQFFPANPTYSVLGLPYAVVRGTRFAHRAQQQAHDGFCGGGLRVPSHVVLVRDCLQFLS